MDLRNKFITKSLMGFVIGTIVGVIFWVINNHAPGEDNARLVLHLSVSALLGLIAMGGSIVYDIESWGVFKATLTHYFVVMTDYVLASTLLKWFGTVREMVIMLIIMTVIYAMIWVAESLYWKKTLIEMNEQLKNMARLDGDRTGNG